MISFLLGIFFFGLTLYVYLTWNFDYWKRRGIVGPRPQPYAGTFTKTAWLDKNSNYISETSEIFRNYYQKHRFVGVFEYREPKLMILDPALVVDIYVKYFKHFGDNTMSETVHAGRDPLFKTNPFIETGAGWKERRSEMAQAFTMLKVKGMYPVMVDSCRKLVTYLNEYLRSGHAGAIASKDVEFCKCLFMVEFDYTFPLAVRKNNIESDNFLHLLMELETKKNLQTISSAANAFTFFLKGFETTSYMLGSAINELAKNKVCQEKLRAEVKSFECRKLDDFNQMPYLDAVINETTRISPFPFPIWKICTESIDLSDYDGRIVHVDKGTKIILPTTALHHHSDFFTDSEKFMPDRFMSNIDEAKKLKDSGVFTPFENGPRICMGIRWATLLMKEVLCSLVNNFEFSVQSTTVRPSAPSGMLFFSDNAVQLKFKRLK